MCDVPSKALMNKVSCVVISSLALDRAFDMAGLGKSTKGC